MLLLYVQITVARFRNVTNKMSCVQHQVQTLVRDHALVDVPRVSLYNRIQIVMRHHGHDKWHDTSTEFEAHMELFELLGISRERVVDSSHEVGKCLRWWSMLLVAVVVCCENNVDKILVYTRTPTRPCWRA